MMGFPELSLLFIIGCLNSGLAFLGAEAKIRGTPGKDYPNYFIIPQTSFRCADQKHNPGLYADPETRCQVFHYCYENRQESFLCPLGTIFNQPLLSCDYWYSSNCSLAVAHYDVNDKKRNEYGFDISAFTPALEEKSGQLFDKMASLYNADEISRERYRSHGEGSEAKSDNQLTGLPSVGEGDSHTISPTENASEHGQNSSSAEPSASATFSQYGELENANDLVLSEDGTLRSSETQNEDGGFEAIESFDFVPYNEQAGYPGPLFMNENEMYTVSQPENEVGDVPQREGYASTPYEELIERSGNEVFSQLSDYSGNPTGFSNPESEFYRRSEREGGNTVRRPRRRRPIYTIPDPKVEVVAFPQQTGSSENEQISIIGVNSFENHYLVQPEHQRADTLGQDTNMIPGSKNHLESIGYIDGLDETEEKSKLYYEVSNGGSDESNLNEKYLVPNSEVPMFFVDANQMSETEMDSVNIENGNEVTPESYIRTDFTTDQTYLESNDARGKSSELENFPESKIGKEIYRNIEEIYSNQPSEYVNELKGQFNEENDESLQSNYQMEVGDSKYTAGTDLYETSIASDTQSSNVESYGDTYEAEPPLNEYTQDFTYVDQNFQTLPDQGAYEASNFKHEALPTTEGNELYQNVEYVDLSKAGQSSDEVVYVVSDTYETDVETETLKDAMYKIEESGGLYDVASIEEVESGKSTVGDLEEDVQTEQVFEPPQYQWQTSESVAGDMAPNAETYQNVEYVEEMEGIAEQKVETYQNVEYVEETEDVAEQNAETYQNVEYVEEAEGIAEPNAETYQNGEYVEESEDYTEQRAEDDQWNTENVQYVYENAESSSDTGLEGEEYTTAEGYEQLPHDYVHSNGESEYGGEYLNYVENADDQGTEYLDETNLPEEYAWETTPESQYQEDLSADLASDEQNIGIQVENGEETMGSSFEGEGVSMAPFDEDSQSNPDLSHVESNLGVTPEDNQSQGSFGDHQSQDHEVQGKGSEHSEESFHGSHEVTSIFHGGSVMDKNVFDPQLPAIDAKADLHNGGSLQHKRMEQEIPILGTSKSKSKPVRDTDGKKLVGNSKGGSGTMKTAPKAKKSSRSMSPSNMGGFVDAPGIEFPFVPSRFGQEILSPYSEFDSAELQKAGRANAGKSLSPKLASILKGLLAAKKSKLKTFGKFFAGSNL